MNRVSQLKIGVVLSYVYLILSSIISIIYTPVMLRLLGQSEFGLFNLANSVVGYLGILNLGLGNAIVRYISKCRAINDIEGEYNLNGMFIVIYSILGFIVAISGVILLFNIDNIFSGSLSNIELEKMKYIMGLMVFNLAVSFPFSVFDSIIIAYEKFVFPKIIGIIRSILNPMIMLPLLFMGYKSITMTLVSTILNLLCIITSMYYCFRILKIKIKFKKIDFSLLKEISIYSFFIFLNIIVDKIYWSTDQFILGAVSGSVAVAIYTIGSTLNTYYMSFSTAISGVFLPKVTSMVTKNSSDKQLSDLFIKTGRIQYIIMSFILYGFILVGEEFILLWAGKGYEESFFITLIVMVPLTIPLIQNIGISILQAKNMHKFRSSIYVLIAFINLFTSIPLAKMYGGIGAAISTGISFFIGNIIIMNIYYYKKIGIDIPNFWRQIGKMTVPITISLLASISIFKYLDISGVLSIVVKGGLFTFIFLVLTWNFAMNSYEKDLFIKPVNKVLLKLGVKRS